ncbi:hypothetical protein GA0111570_11510 [Raineyella antarctica]|uniref:Uncharacterized protein n=1 Tax=Raineyella antarctica TaxID=1577474 RepID=A0A1G6IB79_9ACTN|nr:DUF6361 family protein [Raineyella antarctica]SDC03265.1 hypothetical protein GA0111570_11510 [Raineyella antarctica]
MSSIAWLDTSADEQRRVREVIALFTQKETLDELGIGQIRDTFSDALFPGITTIETRARYFLLVPWAYVKESRPGRSAAQVRVQVERSERDLVRTLNRGERQRGVIGARAGAGVKILPSSIYWNGLLTFGILRRDVGLDQIASTRHQRDAADELASRAGGDWHPTLPPAPKDFPSTLEGGLDLTAPEASWLRERILESVPATLLAHVVVADQPPTEDSPYPWRDETCRSAPDPAAHLMRHAELFSLAVKGATRLYNVLLAEAYERAGFTTVAKSVEEYHEQYRVWLGEVGDARHQLGAWDMLGFWATAHARNPRISPRTRMFVDAWVQGMRDGTAHTALENEAPRLLIANREASLKGKQARLTNRKLLGQWGGGASGGLDYRWGTVKTIITDIHEGLARV